MLFFEKNNCGYLLKTIFYLFSKVKNGDAEIAMIPVDNTVAGRVSDIYHLLPQGELFIIGERYQPIHHQLMAIKSAKLGDIKVARSHPMALGQVRKRLSGLNITAMADVDTAAAARKVAERGDPTVAAVASKLAAEKYGLEILMSDIEDETHNTTRFLVLSQTPQIPDAADGPVVSSYVFKVRSVPSALYKALGGFASNGLNLTKLESYMVGGKFTATQFYADIEGHPDDPAVARALEELDYFTDYMHLMGVYPSAARRHER